MLTQKHSPGRFEPPRLRLDPDLLQDPLDGARGEPDAEPDKLSLDPPVPPTRVLPGETQYERTNLGRRTGMAGIPTRVRPATRHQLPVPPQQRRRSHKERRPLPARKHPTERSQQRPVSGTQPRAPDLPLTAEADAAERVSRSPSPAPTASTARQAPANVAAPSTPTREPDPKNDPPQPMTLHAEPSVAQSSSRYRRRFAPYNGLTILYNEIMSQNAYVMTLSRNGQVSIPADVRARWGTRQLLVVDLGDRVVMRPLSDQPLQELRGKYTGRGPRSDRSRQESRREEKHSQSRRG